MSQLRILLVDDSDIDRMLLRTSLERLDVKNVEIEEACGGASALAAMTQSRFDAVVLDVCMPGESGLDVLRTIRERSHASWPLIVMCSSSNHPTDVDTAYSYLANAYVSKPDSLNGYRRLAEVFHGLFEQVVHPQTQENLSQDAPSHRE